MKALRASQLTVADLSGIAQARVYRKTVAIGGAVVVIDTIRLNISDKRPFGAADPAELASKGYVRGDERQGWEFFGPDETVLLSNEFATTHCFQLVRDDKHPAQIGIRFEPVAKRKTPDIAGLIWLNDSTSELREITFRYVNAGVISRFDGGGITRFRRMISGAWLISEWHLRMPRLEIESSDHKRVTVAGYDEVGGGIVDETIPFLMTSGTTTLNGIVIDSVSGQPLRSATVSIGQTAAATDSTGRFTFTNVPIGSQSISFSHPALSSFGFLALEKGIEVTPEIGEVVLATPSLATLSRRICRDSAQTPAIAERGILHGFVKDNLGKPVADALVTMRWTEYQPLATEGVKVARLDLVVKTDEAGYYVACGFRRMVRGTTAAAAGKLISPRREFLFEESLLARRDLVLQPAATASLPENARELTVIVTDSARQTTLADATVSIDGSPHVVRTDDEGRAVFVTSLADVQLRVRRLGFGEQALRFCAGRCKETTSACRDGSCPVVGDGPRWRRGSDASGDGPPAKLRPGNLLRRRGNCPHAAGQKSFVSCFRFSGRGQRPVGCTIQAPARGQLLGRPLHRWPPLGASRPS